MAKTNLGLIEYARRALKEKWGYVWGTYGQVLTEAILRAKVRQYPSQVGAYQTYIRKNYLDKKTADCIGLIKAYMWETDGIITYDPVTDLNVGGMANRSTDKGPISTIPEIPGLAVHKQGHIGIYVGGGQVIEAHNTSKGVIQTPLLGAGSTPWTGWLMIPYIDYIGVDDMRLILKLGSKGEAVKELQNSLIKLGYNVGVYGADGDFGGATDKAIRLFQMNNGLVSDGIVGEATWTKLDELLKPKVETPSGDTDKYKNALIKIKNIIDEVLRQGEA